MNTKLFELLPFNALEAVAKAKQLKDREFWNIEYFELYLQFQKAMASREGKPDHFDRLVNAEDRPHNFDPKLHSNLPIKGYHNLMLGSLSC